MKKAVSIGIENKLERSNVVKQITVCDLKTLAELDKLGLKDQCGSNLGKYYWTSEPSSRSIVMGGGNKSRSRQIHRYRQ